MTTNEFKHRSVFFRLLDRAVPIIFGQNDPVIALTCWHVQIVDSHGLKYETYTDSLFDPTFGFCFLNPVKSIIIDSFSSADFDNQFSYFKSFYNRLSEYQKSALKSSGLCDNLIYLYESSE